METWLKTDSYRLCNNCNFLGVLFSFQSLEYVNSTVIRKWIIAVYSNMYSSLVCAPNKLSLLCRKNPRIQWNCEKSKCIVFHEEIQLLQECDLNMSMLFSMFYHLYLRCWNGSCGSRVKTGSCNCTGFPVLSGYFIYSLVLALLDIPRV